MEEPETITPEFKDYKNVKTFNVKIKEADYILSISESSIDIHFDLIQKEGNDPFEYEENYTLDKLKKINNVFKMFDSIENVRNSFEELINTQRYTFDKNDENIIFILKIT